MLTMPNAKHWLKGYKVLQFSAMEQWTTFSGSGLAQVSFVINSIQLQVFSYIWQYFCWFNTWKWCTKKEIQCLISALLSSLSHLFLPRWAWGCRHFLFPTVQKKVCGAVHGAGGAGLQDWKTGTCPLPCPGSAPSRAWSPASADLPAAPLWAAPPSLPERTPCAGVWGNLGHCAGQALELEKSQENITVIRAPQW